LLPAALQFLREQDADIVLLQEVYNGKDPNYADNFRMLETLHRELGYPYSDFAPATIDVMEIGEIETGNAILSKFPIRASDTVFFDLPLSKRNPFDPTVGPRTSRSLEHVVIDADGHELNVCNFQGVWDLDGDNDSEQRRKMSNTIIERTSGKANVIVAGDTNAKPTNPAMRSIEEHLTSVFGDSLPTTFNMRRKTNPGYATAAVDLMYVSPDITILDKACPDVDISDHLPLVVSLEVESKGGQ
jgi:endonuclease/exonuclease/phosphatase family metal-dependent hydrolase